MEFDPRLPDDGVNFSSNHPLHDALTLVLGVLGSAVALLVVLFFAADWIAVRLPPSMEQRVFGSMGNSFFEAESAEASSPELQELQALVDRLQLHVEGLEQVEFRVVVLQEEAPNAFAFPGGVIGVTSGLLEGAESENELAFVLAHELGHFANRDHLRGMARGLVLALAATISGASGSGGSVATIGDYSGRFFGREQESDADERALGVVFLEYGHVQGATRFFDRLPAPGSELERIANAYLSTHPVSQERIDELHALASERGYLLEGSLRPALRVPEFLEEDERCVEEELCEDGSAEQEEPAS